MNVTQLILIIRDRDYARGTEVLFANLYVSIFGFLFATVWASGHAWGRNHSGSYRSAFETTISERPGYLGDRTDPHSAHGNTRIPGTYKLQQRYNVALQGGQSITVGQDRSMKDGIHVEQIVFQDINSNNSRDIESLVQQ
ncbi:hypothetical protein C0993_008123 [Termitomyces sp. T159_Od127]|nr:hypothetical protein C0993_008123 [Termitomyces sp. T159_Od127]